METHSQSKSNPSRPIGSKLKKKHHAATDAACGVVLDSSCVKEKHDTTLVAVSTSRSIKINNKMKGKPRAAAVPTGSSGDETLGNPGDAIVLPTGSSGNVSGGNDIKDKHNTIAVGVSNHNIGVKINTGTRPAILTARSDTNKDDTTKPNVIAVEVSILFLQFKCNL
jgi:hypothetical protein